jgi:hypothetical protein
LMALSTSFSSCLSPHKRTRRFRNEATRQYTTMGGRRAPVRALMLAFNIHDVVQQARFDLLGLYNACSSRRKYT